MTEMIRHPAKGFEEAIMAHFKLKAKAIVEQVNQWLKEAQTSKSCML
jgi:hypothetical protein